MKKLVVGTLVAVLVIGTAAFALAQSYGPRPYVQRAQAYGSGWGHGPMHMGPMMGPGYGMGPGMMGRGFGPGAAGFTPPCWQAAGFTQTGQPLTKDSATQILQSYVARTGNPNLKLGEVTETDTAFEGKIVTKDGSLVQNLVVDKATGWVHQTF